MGLFVSDVFLDFIRLHGSFLYTYFGGPWERILEGIIIIDHILVSFFPCLSFSLKTNKNLLPMAEGCL